MDLKYQLVYGNHSQEVDEKIINFWKSENALQGADEYTIQE
jgi:hypothetical protein